MDVLEYDTYRDFLRDWFDNSSLSQRAVAKALGREGDPGLLGRILSGKRRLPASLVEPLITLMELDDTGARALRLLVRIAHPRTTDEKAEAELALAGLRATQEAVRVRDAEVYRHWLFPVVAELSQLEGFVDDPQWVMDVLDPPVAAADVVAALEHARKRKKVVITTERVDDIDVFGYYRGMHGCTAHALDQLQRSRSYAEESMFLGLTLSVPESQVHAMRRRLLEIQTEFLGVAEASSETEPAGRVVQVNLQLFPMSRHVPPRTSVQDTD